jgi:hypothetical protein
MVDVKEIKSVELVPFTLMTSSVSAILALIYAIILLITFGAIAAFIPMAGLVLASLGISMIILFPLGTFLVYITISFVTALIYNMLVPRLGGVKLGLEGNEIKELPVVSYALILAAVEAVWAFIIGLFLALLLVPMTTLLSTLIPIAGQAMNATNLTGSAVGTGGVIIALMLIIGLPIMVFIFGFIGHALAAIFYNFIIPKVGGVRLELAAAGTAHEITSIPVVAASLAIASVALIFGIIYGILQLITLASMGDAVGGIVALIMYIITYFVGTFIMVAIITIIYNFLAPRIGGVQLGLE